MTSTFSLTRLSILVTVLAVVTIPAVAGAYAPGANPSSIDSAGAATVGEASVPADGHAELFQAGIVDTEEAGGGNWVTDSLSPVVVSSVVGGFVFGTLLSVALVKRRRLGRHFESLAPGGETGRPDRPAAVDSGTPVRDSDERGPTGEEDAANGDDDEFFTDEARVNHLLEQQNGRMKQSAIVEETEWSKSKVSRVVSRMAEDGDVRKIGLGRENLICLPGQEPEIATRSR
jgi:hypothetical protein